MINKLKKKFILISTLSATIVFVIIMLIFNITNYSISDNNTDKLLEILLFNNGERPEIMASDNKINNNIFGINKDMLYEARFFSVFVDNVNTAYINKKDILRFSDDDILNYVSMATKENKRIGKLDKFKYIVGNSYNGKLVVFVDISSDIYNLKYMLMTSIMICVLGILSIFVLVVAMSKYIIRPIEESYKRQKQFITNASHEIKTPLTIIDANADIIEMQIGSNEWLDSIKKQVYRLTSMTNDLVELSRMDEKDTDTLMIPFAISDVIKETCETFIDVANLNGKKLDICIEENLSLKGNEKDISQLIRILLENALKYSKDNSGIVVTMKKVSSRINIRVSNEVNYIEKGNHNEFFERFFRYDKSRNSKIGGYGIGLSIAKAIMLAHNGNIDAYSDDEHSFTIDITL